MDSSTITSTTTSYDDSRKNKDTDSLQADLATFLAELPEAYRSYYESLPSQSNPRRRSTSTMTHNVAGDKLNRSSIRSLLTTTTTSNSSCDSDSSSFTTASSGGARSPSSPHWSSCSSRTNSITPKKISLTSVNVVSPLIQSDDEDEPFLFSRDVTPLQLTKALSPPPLACDDGDDCASLSEVDSKGDNDDDDEMDATSVSSEQAVVTGDDFYSSRNELWNQSVRSFRTTRTAATAEPMDETTCSATPLPERRTSLANAGTDIGIPALIVCNSMSNGSGTRDKRTRDDRKALQEAVLVIKELKDRLRASDAIANALMAALQERDDDRVSSSALARWRSHRQRCRRLSGRYGKSGNRSTGNALDHRHALEDVTLVVAQSQWLQFAFMGAMALLSQGYWEGFAVIVFLLMINLQLYSVDYC